jgi:sec-independent protein translocase protein TatC
MPTTDEEAQLEQTKMSFGEHLEELRRALFRSILALLAGFVVGLFIGMPLVDYIQEPLRRALIDYHHRRAEAKVRDWLEKEQAAGRSVPENLNEAAKEMVKRGGVPHEYLVDRDELAAALRELGLAAGPELTPPSGQAAYDAETEESADALSSSTGDMIRLRLWEPLTQDAHLNTISTNSFEPMLVYFKAAFAAGLVLASPAIFYFIWQFVASGLYKSEKQYVHIYLPLSLSLFIVGAAIAYYFALDQMLTFLFWFHERMGIEPYPKLSDWIMTVVLMPLGFGVSFQLPLIMLLLERIGIFTVADYLRKWRIAVVVIAVASMVLTPSSDIGSMILMFVPLTGLYFVGIFMCRSMPGGPIRSPLRDHPPEPKPPASKPEENAGS